MSSEFVAVSIDVDVDDEDPTNNTAFSSPHTNGRVPIETNTSPSENEEENTTQRSLLKTLWSEATSTTSFPQLHHRHTTAAGSNGATAYNRKGSAGSTNGNSSPSKKRPAGRQHGSGKHHHFSSRGARIAKRVWLAAFAAFGAALLISVHVILYRLLFGAQTNDNNNTEDAASSEIMQYLSVEDQQPAMTLSEAHSHTLASITNHPIDTSQYTIRMNTWHRNEQLLLSVNHHAKCEGVKEIQIIWCDSDNEPPKELVHHKSGKVKVERHVINSLNERFKVLMDPPTLGILSLDDDVLRPCEALDAAFIRWARHPERMLGFDVRTHVVDEESSNWKYGYMSTTESSNRYSLTLPRASFLHRDYLDLYTMALPRPMYAYVAKNFECEDIAMSFFVSSLTGGKPPLIADYWAVKSMIKLYSETKISGGKDHKSARDKCVNDFAEMLGLKGSGVVDGVTVQPLQTGKLRHRNAFFGYGSEPEDWSNIDLASFQSEHLREVVLQMLLLNTLSNAERMAWLGERKTETMSEAKSVGMIEKTEEWKKRWV